IRQDLSHPGALRCLKGGPQFGGPTDTGGHHGRSHQPAGQPTRGEVPQAPGRGQRRHRRLQPPGRDPGTGEDPGQPDQRLRVLPRHAHQGRRPRRRDRDPAAPGRGVAGGDGVHRGRTRGAGTRRAGHPARRRRRCDRRRVGPRRQAPRRGATRGAGRSDRADQRLQPGQRHRRAAGGRLSARPVRLTRPGRAAGRDGRIGSRWHRQRTAMFILVLTAILALIHLYLWKRLVKDTTVAGRTRWLLTGVLGALFVVLIAALLLPRMIGVTATRWLAWPGYLWFAVAGYLLLILLVLEPLRVVLRRRPRREP